MKRILLLAAVIYFFLAPITFHSDNKAVMQWISNDYWRVWNIYEHTRSVFGEGFVFHYPPMHFLLSKLQWPLASIIGGSGYYEWLNKNTELAIYDNDIYRYNLATKTPLILFALLSGYMLYKLAHLLTGDEHRSRLAAGLWLFNPITQYSIPIMGQNDVLAILFFLGGWFLLQRHFYLSILFFGISVSVKSYPLLWIVMLMISMTKWSYRKRMSVAAGSLLVYGLTLLPFLSSQAYRSHSLNAAINDRFFIPQINLGFEKSIYIIPLILLVWIFYIIRKTQDSKLDLSAQSWLIMTPTLFFFSSAHFHPQWFTGVSVFWALWVATSDSWQKIKMKLVGSVGFFLAWFWIVLLFKDKFLTWGIISPLNPHLANLPVIYDFLVQAGIKVSTWVNLGHTFVAAIAILALFLVDNLRSITTIPLHPILNFYWLKFKFLRIGSVMVLPVALFGLIFIAHLLPAPIGILATDKPHYISPDIPKVDTQFLSENNMLNRIDLYMKNPGLSSKDTLLFELKDEKGALLYTLPFSAFNAGDPTLVRFDFPPIPDSKDREYLVSLTKTHISQEPLKLGVSNTENNTLSINHYYKADFALPSVMNSSLILFWKIVQQIPGWIVLISIGMTVVINYDLVISWLKVKFLPKQMV